MTKLLDRRNQLVKEIEEHFNMSALEVAENKKLRKDPFFVERDKEIDQIDSLIETELF